MDCGGTILFAAGGAGAWMSYTLADRDSMSGLRSFTGLPCTFKRKSEGGFCLSSPFLGSAASGFCCFVERAEGGKSCQAIIDLSGCCLFAGIYLEAGIRGSVHGDFCRSKFTFSDLENDRRRSFRITLRN